MIAPGVSSTIRSTPVASSSARMLRPSRPMMRPFRSSLGRSTTDTVVSIGVLGGAALDGLGDVLLGAVGGRLARLGVEPLHQVGGVVPRVAFDLLEQQLLGLVGRQAGDALELVLLLGDELLVLARPRPAAAFSRSASAAVARPQLLLEPLERATAARPSGRLAAASAPARASAACWRCCGPAARPPRSGRAPFPWPRAALPSCGSRRRARRPSAMRSGLFLGAADGFGGDALAVGDPDQANTAPAATSGDQRG